MPQLSLHLYVPSVVIVKRAPGVRLGTKSNKANPWRLTYAEAKNFSQARASGLEAQSAPNCEMIENPALVKLSAQ